MSKKHIFRGERLETLAKGAAFPQRRKESNNAGPEAHEHWSQIGSRKPPTLSGRGSGSDPVTLTRRGWDVSFREEAFVRLVAFAGPRRLRNPV